MLLKILRMYLKKIQRFRSQQASETAQKQIPNGTILGSHLRVTQGYLTYTYFVVDPNKQIA